MNAFLHLYYAADCYEGTATQNSKNIIKCITYKHTTNIAKLYTNAYTKYSRTPFQLQMLNCKCLKYKLLHS